MNFLVFCFILGSFFSRLLLVYIENLIFLHVLDNWVYNFIAVKGCQLFIIRNRLNYSKVTCNVQNDFFVVHQALCLSLKSEISSSIL